MALYRRRRQRPDGRAALTPRRTRGRPAAAAPHRSHGRRAPPSRCGSSRRATARPRRPRPRRRRCSPPMPTCRWSRNREPMLEEECTLPAEHAMVVAVDKRPIEGEQHRRRHRPAHIRAAGLAATRRACPGQPDPVGSRCPATPPRRHLRPSSVDPPSHAASVRSRGSPPGRSRARTRPAAAAGSAPARRSDAARQRPSAPRLSVRAVKTAEASLKSCPEKAVENELLSSGSWQNRRV
jgi:hypothetical protein